MVIAAPILFTAYNAFDVWQTSGRKDRDKTDAIVVMGAAQYNGRPSAVFKARLDHAKALYVQKLAPLIVILGGSRPGDRFTEAQAGAAYLEKTLPANRVTGVKSGANTLDSFKKFTGLARTRHIKRILIVSDPLHLARARSMAAHQGFDVTVSGATVPASKEHRRSGLVRETLSLMYYRVFHEG